MELKSALHHPLAQRIERLLRQDGCWFETFEHEPVRTSEEAARVRTGYGLEHGAKALIIRSKRGAERRFAMVVVPGDRRMDSSLVKQMLDARDIRFATSDEVGTVTGGVEPGGVPPFGNLFEMQVLCDPAVVAHERIIFNAGDRGFSIAIRSADYVRLVRPLITDVAA